MNKKLTIIGFLIFAAYMAYIVSQVVVAIEMTSEAMDRDPLLNFERLVVSQIEEKSEVSEVPESLDDSPALSVLETPEQIKAYITKIANHYDISPELPLKIAECESNFKNVCNYQWGCVAGIGIFQLTQTTFDKTIKRIECSENCTFDEDVDVYDPQDNIDVALWLMNKGEYWRWQQSEHCWGTGTPSEP